MPNRHRGLAALALLVAACRCAGLGAGRPAEEYVAPEARPALVVPSLVGLADHLQALVAHAKGDVGGNELASVEAKLAQQLGFDPLTKEGLQQAGIDPRGSFALGAEKGRAGGLVAVPVGDGKVLDETVARLARDRAGAGVREERTVSGSGPGEIKLEPRSYKVVVFSKEPAGPPRVATARRGRHLLVGVGAQAVEHLLNALAMSPERSLAGAEGYRSALKTLGTRDLYLHGPKVEGKSVFASEATLGVAIDERSVSLRGVAMLPPEYRERLAKALPGGGAGAVSQLAPGAPLYVRAGVDLSTLWKQLAAREPAPGLVEKLTTAATAAGLDLDTELFGALEPGVALSLQLAPSLHVASAMDPNPRRHNPADDFDTLALLKAKDPAKVEAALAKVATLLPQLEADLSATTVEADGVKVTTVSYERGELGGWLLDGPTLVLFSGLEGAEALRRVRAGTGPSPEAFPPKSAGALTMAPGAAVGLDMGSLFDSLQKLPPTAFGSGPSAFMARSAMSGVLRTLSHLRGVVSLAPTETGGVLDVTVSMP